MNIREKEENKPGRSKGCAVSRHDPWINKVKLGGYYREVGVEKRKGEEEK